MSKFYHDCDYKFSAEFKFLKVKNSLIPITYQMKKMHLHISCSS